MPGYYNNEGGALSGGLNGQTFTPGINRFNALLAEWRAKGDLEGLELVGEGLNMEEAWT